jgi:predicted RNA-binding protein with PIN domain
MAITDIPGTRLTSQHISSRKYKTVKVLINYMGAIQAQDYLMSKWAIGVRLENSSEKIINEAIDKGEILRTHLLRPTWHFVSSENIYWMLELTASRIKQSMSSRNRELDLTREVFKKSNRIIRDVLKGNNHLTREELIVILNKAKIKTDKNRASHLFAEAELSGIICSGKTKGNKHTYALLEERVSMTQAYYREKSLSKLARIYFHSRGPATLKDFSWWSGLNLTESGIALELIKSELISFENNSQTYWFSDHVKENKNQQNKIYLLPAFDEYLISYADRSAVLISEEHKSIVSTNGMFHAIIVFDGKIIGTWKRTIKKDKVSVQFEYFKNPSKKVDQLVKKETENLGRFLGKKLS